MAIIRKLKDDNNNTVYPMSTLENIFVLDNFTLKELLQKLQIWNLSNDYTYEYRNNTIDNLTLDLYSKNQNYNDLNEGNNIISVQIPEVAEENGYDNINLRSSGVIVANIMHGPKYPSFSKGTYILAINCDKNNTSINGIDRYYNIESYTILHQIN